MKDNKKLEELEKKNAEMLNDLQRTRADFENFRKQVEMQKENEKKAARMATVHKILPLLDNIDRAIKSYEELRPLEKSLEKTLHDLSLVKLPSEPGIDFNPDLHNAMMVDGDGEKEVIEEVLLDGYNYEGEILRPAMVKVKRV